MATTFVEKKVNVHQLVKTKIVCTLGPASSSREVLEQMTLAGMDIVRLNFSHGSHEDHQRIFDTVRELSKKYDEQVSIICDIQGPKIRTGRVQEPFDIHTGDTIRVTPEDIVGNKDRISIKYPGILDDLKQGDFIFINDGIVKLSVQDRSGSDLVCRCEAGGHISDHKGCNIPNASIAVEVLTAKDKKDLAFIAKLNPEFVAASFIGSAEDVQKVRQCLADNGNPNIKVIAKIERPAALKNLDAIIEATDAVMVARGDLGVEIPPHEVPIAQKTMVKKCNQEGRPVIVATQMLESMTTQSRPTRAEVSDVFNAVLDGADAVMLSGETSVGQYVVDAVRVMNDIAQSAEPFIPRRNPNEYNSRTQALSETIGHSVYSIVEQFNHIGYKGKIIVLADSSYIARMVSKYRPAMDIIVFTNDLRVTHELNLVWGARTVYDSEISAPKLEDRAIQAIHKALKLHLVGTKDHVVVVARSLLGKHIGSFTGVYDVEKVLSSNSSV